MQCHRIEELLELLQPAWIKEQDLSLVQFVAKLAEEAGFEGPLSELTDDMLIYHLKMRESDKQAMIPGLARITCPTSRKPCSRPAASSKDCSSWSLYWCSKNLSKGVSSTGDTSFLLLEIATPLEH